MNLIGIVSLVLVLACLGIFEIVFLLWDRSDAKDEKKKRELIEARSQTTGQEDA